MTSCIAMASQMTSPSNVLKTYANGEPVGIHDDKIVYTNNENNGDVTQGACATNYGSAATAQTLQNNVSKYGPVVRRRRRNVQNMSPSTQDKASLRKRDSFEVLEEWVNVSIHEDVDCDIGDLPSHIDDALSSSFHSGIKIEPKAPKQDTASTDFVSKRRFESIPEQYSQEREELDNTSSICENCENGATEKHNRIRLSDKKVKKNKPVDNLVLKLPEKPDKFDKYFLSPRLAKKSKRQDGLSPQLTLSPRASPNLTLSPRASPNLTLSPRASPNLTLSPRSSPRASPMLDKKINRSVDYGTRARSYSDENDRVKKQRFSTTKSRSFEKTSPSASDTSVSFQKRVPFISTAFGKKKTEDTESPSKLDEQNENEQNISHKVDANHSFTDKSLLQKLKESTGNYMSSVDKEKTQSPEPKTERPLVSNNVPLEQSDHPLRRMDSFELLEEWCNLSIPPDSEEDFGNILNSHGTDILNDGVIKGTENVDIIAQKIRKLSIQGSDCDSGNPQDDTENDDVTISDITDVTDDETDDISISVSDISDSPIGISDQKQAPASNGISKVLSEDEAEDLIEDSAQDKTDKNFERKTEYESETAIYGNVNNSGKISDIADNSGTTKRETNNEKDSSNIESTKSAQYILDVILWNVFTHCDKQIDALHLDLDLIKNMAPRSNTDPMSSSYIFQEKNFIQSPLSPPMGSQSCFNLNTLGANEGAFEGSHDNDVTMENNEHSENSPTSYEAIIKSKPVFKEPNFCPSPLQLSTPLQSPISSPRGPSPLRILPQRSISSRSGSSSPAISGSGALQLPPLSVLDGQSVRNALNQCETRSSNSSSPSVRSPRESRSPDNLSLDSGALSIASWELDLSSGEIETPQESSSQASDDELSALAASARNDMQSDNVTYYESTPKRSPLYNNYGRRDLNNSNIDSPDLMSPKQAGSMYDLNGRRVAGTPRPNRKFSDDVTRRSMTPPTSQNKTPTPPGQTRGRQPVMNKTALKGTPSARIYNAPTFRFKSGRPSLGKAVSMPNVAAKPKTSDLPSPTDELFVKQQRQMRELKEERAKLQQQLQKQKVDSPQGISKNAVARKSPSTKKLRSSSNASDLKSRELEAVTRLNTLVNGKQLAKLITKATASSMASICEACDAVKVKWAEHLQSFISEENLSSKSNDQVSSKVRTPSKPILRQRDANFQYPFNDDPITPVVVRRTQRIPRIRKSLAHLDPSKV